MKWLTKQRKAPARDRSADFMRHSRVADRLALRINEAVEVKDVGRVNVLMARLRRVRDIQIRDLEH